MKILVDMHTHLNEKKIKPKEYWKATKEKKLKIIAITEHAEFNPELAYKKLLKTKPKNILLIPGMEANTSAGHFLIFGEDEKIYKFKELQKIKINIKKVIEIVEKNNFLGVFAHPYGYKTDSTCEILGEEKTKVLLKKHDIGVEYYNGMLGSANNFIFGTEWVKKLYNFFDFVSKSKTSKKLKIKNKSHKIKTQLEQISQETFQRVRKGIEFSENAKYITSGSDAHYPRVIGSAIIELKKMPKNNKEFLQMIKQRKINWVGPNIYSKEPVDTVRKKELLEGLTYITKNKIKKKIKKNKYKKKEKKLIPKIKLKKNLTKRIKKKKIINKLRRKK